jgi:hypothetical protein
LDICLGVYIETVIIYIYIYHIHVYIVKAEQIVLVTVWSLGGGSGKENKENVRE